MGAGAVGCSLRKSAHTIHCSAIGAKLYVGIHVTTVTAAPTADVQA